MPGVSRRLPVWLCFAGVLTAWLGIPELAYADSWLDRWGTRRWEELRRTSSDPAARHGALDVALRFGGNPLSNLRTAEGLLRAGSQDDAGTHMIALSSVVRSVRTTPEAGDVLLHYLQSSSLAHNTAESVRGAALTASELLSSPISFNALLQQGTASGENRELAARALGAMPEQFFNAGAERRSSMGAGLQAVLVRSLGYRRDPRWGPTVLEFLRSSYVELVSAAIEASVRLRLVEARPQLEQIASGASAAVLRRAAWIALAQLGVRPSDSVFLQGIEDPQTRAAVLEAMGQLGDPTFVPLIVPLFRASWAPDRRAAAEALGAIGSSEALIALRNASQNETDEETRAALWQALSRCSGSASLLREAGARDATARSAIVSLALRGERWEQPSEVVSLAQQADASSLRLLALRGAQGPLFATLLRASEVSRRRAAAVALSLRPGAVSEEALATVFERESDEGVRVALALALARSGGEIAEQTLVSLLLREEAEPSLAAQSVLSELSPMALRRSGRSLFAMLSHRSPRVRQLALRAIGSTREASFAGGVLERLRFDDAPEVRGAAGIALAMLWNARSLDALYEARYTSWTRRMIDQMDRARALAERGIPISTEGTSVFRVRGAPPGSVWGMPLMDGALQFAVASEDGEVFFSRVPAGEQRAFRFEQ